MGERKVLNKYFGPDFDPEKIPRKKRAKNDQFVVRMMLPMSIRCKECGEYMYKGKKFNSRRENAEGENYLGIQIIRFYMNCTNCRAEFCIKTDPKNEDYVAEAGAHRNYEPWRDKDAAIEAEYTKRAAEDEMDAMKKLENRTKDSKLEMDTLDTLDELRTMNARNNAASIDALIARKREPDEAEETEQAPPAPRPLDEDDEEMVQRLFGQNGKRTRRMDDSDEEDARAPPPKAAEVGNGLLEVAAAIAAKAPARPAALPARPAGVLIKPAIRVLPKAAAAAAAGSSSAQHAAASSQAAAAQPGAAAGGGAPNAGAGAAGPAAAGGGCGLLPGLGDYASSDSD
ncbi:hypothetical protein T492DRAFT_1106504 [Pavlovales sp. CCMP2436]|nr:hypothetical protein T492DRAFT_1106504 [Pavlovales sp. CCMP2436]|mmetsp:Transcript_5983/g.15690  ORF Transcript_5983/g.15690 Transcript_5983/m.15690 type:complete len:342 (-) Transcript_5983:87-1112(-)